MSKDRLRVLFCDHLNVARGKYLPAWKIGDGATRFCRGTFGVTHDMGLIPAPGAMMLEGLPDMEVIYRAEEIRGGWENATRMVVGDLHASDGTPLPMCGRGALKRAIADWHALGYEAMVGIELEAFAFQIEPDGTLKPYDTPGAAVYSTGVFADPRGFTDAIWNTAEAAGFRIDSMNTEFDSPQYEFTLTYDTALKAVDDIFLFRLMAREVAFRHGIVLTFLPKPIAAKGGSGVHVNFSLRDGAGGNAIVGGTADPAKLNALTRGCIAGLLHHHRGLAGLVAPCANSYDRLKPASLSGYWCNWGVDHRGVTTRISAETGAAARLEHRMGDGAANPYTLTAAVLQAARLGVVNNYALPPAETGDCFETMDATVGVPDDLGAALEALEADTALVEAVGELLVANHAAVKREEIARTSALAPEAVPGYYIRHV
ncbi:MAG: glutamine synthetase [Burkholderiales bacterium]|nr:glutamine synthetase [Burkholderiales bacterium]